MVSVNIGCRDNLSVTSYIIKDTVRYFFMVFFLRYTKWLILPGKLILNTNISSTYKVQTQPPPPNIHFSIQKYYCSENFKISPLITFIEWWFVYIPVGDMCENIHQQWQWETVTWQGVSAPSRNDNLSWHFHVIGMTSCHHVKRGF